MNNQNTKPITSLAVPEYYPDASSDVRERLIIQNQIKIIPMFGSPIINYNKEFLRGVPYPEFSVLEKFTYSEYSALKKLSIILEGLNAFNDWYTEYALNHSPSNVILDLKPETAEYYLYIENRRRMMWFWAYFNKFSNLSELAERFVIFNMEMSSLNKQNPDLLKFNHMFIKNLLNYLSLAELVKVYLEKIILQKKIEMTQLKINLFKAEQRRQLEELKLTVDDELERINSKSYFKFEFNEWLKENQDQISSTDLYRIKPRKVSNSISTATISKTEEVIKENLSIIPKDRVEQEVTLTENELNEVSKNIHPNNKRKITLFIQGLYDKNYNFNIGKDTFSPNSLPVLFSVKAAQYRHEGILRINQYIKAMSMFTLKHKGIILVFSKIVGFHFNTQANILIKNVYKFLAYAFKSMGCIISKPVFVMTPDKIVIQLFFYLYQRKLNRRKLFRRIRRWKRSKLFNQTKKIFVYKNPINPNQIIWPPKTPAKYKFNPMIINKIIWNNDGSSGYLIISFKPKLSKYHSNITPKFNPKKLKAICDILSSYFKKDVELDLIRLHYPHNDATILVNIIGALVKLMKVRVVFRKIIRRMSIMSNRKHNVIHEDKKNKVFIIPASISGFKVRIAGRLMTQRVVPRKTIKQRKIGPLTSTRVNYQDTARFTRKNKRGAYSITVYSTQKFYTF